MINLNLA